MELKPLPLNQIVTNGYNTKIDSSILGLCKGSNKSFKVLREYTWIFSLVLVRIIDLIAYGETYTTYIGKVTSLNSSYCEIEYSYKIKGVEGKTLPVDIETGGNLKADWDLVFPILIKSYTLEALGFNLYDIRGFKGYRLKTNSGFLKVRKQSSYWDDDEKVEDPIWEFVYGKIIGQGRYIYELIDFIKHLKIKSYE